MKAQGRRGEGAAVGGQEGSEGTHTASKEARRREGLGGKGPQPRWGNGREFCSVTQAVFLPSRPSQIEQRTDWDDN